MMTKLQEWIDRERRCIVEGGFKASAGQYDRALRLIEELAKELAESDTMLCERCEGESGCPLCRAATSYGIKRAMKRAGAK